MRLVHALLALFMLAGTVPAYADWQSDATDGSGTTVTKFRIHNGQRQVYHFFSDDTDSSWIRIDEGFKVDICLNDDVLLAANGDATAQVLHLLHNLSHVTPALKDAKVLIAVTLDGTNCIFDVEGPRWIMVDAEHTTEDAYVSVIARGATRR
jgi:hypothetical protein